MGGGTAFMCNDLIRIPGFDVTQKKWVWQFTFPDPALREGPLDENLLLYENHQGFPKARRCHAVIHEGSRKIT